VVVCGGGGGEQDGSLDVDEMRDMWKTFGVADGETCGDVVALTFYVILDQIKCSPNCRNFIEPKLPKYEQLVGDSQPKAVASAPVAAALPDDDEVRACTPEGGGSVPHTPRWAHWLRVRGRPARRACLRCFMPTLLREGVSRCYCSHPWRVNAGVGTPHSSLLSARSRAATRRAPRQPRSRAP
jgi:hypothetical protein